MSVSIKSARESQEEFMSKLFSPIFMIKYTKFKSFNSLLDSSGFNVKTLDEFVEIPEDVLDPFISSTTSFSSWQEMFGKAIEQYVTDNHGKR